MAYFHALRDIRTRLAVVFVIGLFVTFGAFPALAAGDSAKTTSECPSDLFLGI